ncbi:cation:H+ antiporter [Hathewaya proteolytica DSM 3090]|uniref:Cation:H+ antiporter n=1 Tax=Hathewaya proteolytica DSM 3090 TaxID=1121331 RepID=A0A1M6PRL8_9CLOT|nr:calcium/sodium antiporter [Hathewaya proteolytica]SHK10532.1 cation:H+ antiporter [Hathewaya proteolytica DSM 3090]
MELLVQVLFLALGFLMLVKGADWFVEGVSGVATRFGIPQIVIGLTIVAMGTSAPEAAVSITAAIKGSADITIGNIVGSNILNILIILGITAVIIPVAVQKSTLKIDMPYMILASVVLFITGWTGEVVGRMEGIIFLVFFIGFLAYLFYISKNNREEDTGLDKRPMWKLLAFSLLGLVLIVWGSDVTVDSATTIARVLGLSERFIGLTIVALGTSLPELFTSVMAAVKGKADIAIGNIVGSNIFNILFIVGISSLITPVPFAPNFLIDTVISAAAALLLIVCVAKKKLLERWAGVLMLLCYAAYFAYLSLGF